MDEAWIQVLIGLAVLVCVYVASRVLLTLLTLLCMFFYYPLANVAFRFWTCNPQKLRDGIKNDTAHTLYVICIVWPLEGLSTGFSTLTSVQIGQKEWIFPAKFVNHAKDNADPS